jgi:L-amino acid N-acyltransferase YncA
MNADALKSTYAEAHRIEVRPAQLKDLSSILEISNWATRHTAATFRIEPDTLEHWIQRWNERHESYPWLVACAGGTVVGFATAAPLQGR